MNRSPFLIELLTYSILVPGSVLCYLPVRDQLRLRLKNLILLLAAFFLLILPLIAWADYYFYSDYQTLFLPFSLLCFVLYFLTLRCPFSKALCVFLAVSVLLAFLSNFSNGFDAVLHPDSSVNQFSMEAALFQLGLTTLACGLLAYPFSRYGSYLINRSLLPQVWLSASAASALFLLFNLFIVPRIYSSLYVEQIFRVYWVLLSIIFLLYLFLLFCFYFLVVSLLRAAEINDRNRLLEMQDRQYHLQQEYLEATSRERHDFRQTVRTLDTLIRDENYPQARDLLSEYIQNMPQNALVQYCSNLPLNALLNHYRQTAEKYSIRIHLVVALPDSSGISDVDLCSIVGNILENAIDACLTLPEQNRWIHLSILERHQSMLYIVATNSFNGKVRFLNEQYYSTKHPGSGLGLSSILSTAEKYDGTAQFSHDGGRFMSSVALPLNRPDS